MLAAARDRAGIIRGNRQDRIFANFNSENHGVVGIVSARPVDVHVNLSSLEGQRACDERRLEYFGVETLEQRDVAALFRRRENDDAAALGGGNFRSSR